MSNSMTSTSLSALTVSLVLLLTSSPFFAHSSSSSALASPISGLHIAAILSFVSRQYSTVYEQWLAAPSAYPNYGRPQDKRWQTLSSKDGTFTNGFFPGRFFHLVSRTTLELPHHRM